MTNRLRSNPPALIRSAFGLIVILIPGCFVDALDTDLGPRGKTTNQPNDQSGETGGESAGSNSSLGGADGKGSGGAPSDSSGGVSGDGGSRPEESGGTGGDPDGSGGREAGGTAGTGSNSGQGGSGVGGGENSTGGNNGTGGSEPDDCVTVNCDDTQQPSPLGQVCFEFETGRDGGFQISSGVGCEVEFDGKDFPPPLQTGGVGEGLHRLEIQGCVSPFVSWSCWDGIENNASDGDETGD